MLCAALRLRRGGRDHGRGQDRRQRAAVPPHGALVPQPQLGASAAHGPAKHVGEVGSGYLGADGVHGGDVVTNDAHGVAVCVEAAGAGIHG